MPSGNTRKRVTRATTLVVAAIATFAGVPSIASAQSEPAAAETGPRHFKKYQLGKHQLAAQGYDVVAYFPEGDIKGNGRAVKGNKGWAVMHRGVLYRFSSTANRDLFKKNPARYEPAYGGWCAYAIAKKGFTKPDPKNFIIQNDRLMLFYKSAFSDTKKSWKKEGPALLEPRADAFWRRETGERPPAPEARKAPA